MEHDNRIGRGYQQGRALFTWLRRIHRADYLTAKGNDFRAFTRVALLITAAFLCTTIIWDHAIDPVNARHTIGLRLIESLAVLVWAALGWNDIHAVKAKVIALVGPLVVSLTFLLVLSRLDNGPQYGIGGFLYFFIFMPFLLVGQSIGFAVLALAAVSVFPLVIAPLGWVAPLDWAIYNAYVWMGFVPVVGIQLLCEYLYWRVFVYRGRVEMLAVTDALTGLANRRRFFMESVRILENHRRSRRRASLLFIDIDHFKRINDSYGHITGDTALCHVVDAIEPYLRKSDLMARYGGEEFVVLLPETSHRAARIAAERMRLAVREHPFHDVSTNDGPLRLTVSIGVASYRPTGSDAPDIDVLIQSADDALYQAKQRGRDQVYGMDDATRSPSVPPRRERTARRSDTPLKRDPDRAASTQG